VKVEARREQWEWNVLDTNSVPRQAGGRVQQALLQRTVMNGATDGATVKASQRRTRMNAGSLADWEVMIEHM
jgi:hypothetical protein